MFGVIALAGLEQLINTALRADSLAGRGLSPLSGKVMRVIISQPDIWLDVIFCDDHVRFEPVARAVFEMPTTCQADCTITASSPRTLIALLSSSDTNADVDGDRAVFEQVGRLIRQFEPDVLDRLEGLVGADVSSYLELIATQLHPFTNSVKTALRQSLGDLFRPPTHDRSGEQFNAQFNAQLDDQIQQKQRQLQELQNDIEREQARLDQLQATQAKLTD